MPLTREELENFISVQPLYGRLNTILPEFINEISPRVVFLYCDVCKSKLPFRSLPDDSWHFPVNNRHKQTKGPLSAALHPRMTGTYEFLFKCSGCDQSTLISWIEVNFENNFIRKVGQSIPWSIDIGKELEKDLGDDKNLYKKALILLSQSYGIGACAYLRRIIENQINPMLQILYEIKQSEGAEETELQQIAETIKSKNFTTKIELASAILPDSIFVEGRNPVKLMHDQFSRSIHALDDAEAVSVATGLKGAFEYLVVELNRRQRSRKQFIGV